MHVTLNEAHEITLGSLLGCPHYRSEALIVTAAYVCAEDWYQLQQHLNRCDAIGTRWIEETRAKV